MNQLSSKDKRAIIGEFCPQPGYVLKLTRIQFEELVDDSIGIDISADSSSNGKRLKDLLNSCTDEQITTLLEALRAI